jgi:hypothetical protein
LLELRIDGTWLAKFAPTLESCIPELGEFGRWGDYRNFYSRLFFIGDNWIGDI